MYKSGGDETENMLLLTTGDALASFLERPDSHTEGMGTAEKSDFENGIWDIRWVAISPMAWLPRRRRSSFRAIGTRWWVVDMLL